MLIDTHCHLDSNKFSLDLDTVIHNAFNQNVKILVTLGDDISSSERNIEIANSYENIYCAVGIHPETCLNTTDSDLLKIFDMAVNNDKVKAIGEIGLDLHCSEVPIDKQIEVLTKQMNFAEHNQILWVIHCRDAEEYLLNILSTRDYKSVGSGIIHCFNGSQKALDAYIKYGFYVSIGAYVGYPSSKNVLSTISQIPLNRLLLETDSPYLPPQSKRGKRNEPAYVVETAQFLSKLYNIDLSELEEITSDNALRAFGI